LQEKHVQRSGQPSHRGISRTVRMIAPIELCPFVVGTTLATDWPGVLF